MLDYKIKKLKKHLNAYYRGGVDYRRGSFYFNGIRVHTNTIVGPGFIKWLLENDKIKMRKLKRGIIGLLVDYNKSREGIIEYLFPLLK